ncbi:MAG: GNAT family N-acetyltransferase [Roseinatronobacter sp.]|nr:MAG: GNAT family N-acetyltransferase [Roseinatronobacter sp.]
MSLPDAASLMAALDATWPAQATHTQDGWRLRDGAGGGKRVSAASPLHDDAPLSTAEAWMQARGQRPLFRLTAGEATLDAVLTGRGYNLLDPTVIYAGPVADLARKPGHVSLFDIWPPLAIMRDIWAEGGIGPARIAVMERACTPKTGLVARIEDRAAGVAFCALHDKIAMVHAIEVLPHMRRKGVGALIVQGAAWWAQAQGAHMLALAVTDANTGARTLYERLGLQVCARYHYREQGLKEAQQ